MRKGLLAITGILLLAAGGAVGWFAAKRGAISVEQKLVVYYRAGDKDLFAPAPSWEEWKYPESRVPTHSTSGGSKVGEIEFGSAHEVVAIREPAPRYFDLQSHFIS